ncbi:ABC transporter substrate-binding protein [Ancylobacter sp. 6x-1]|uniref:ABC transporter substrate-binding protein n=1 Tax=Ancylobacter crimeensis TaxID=2579147 RepID=A0ABT0DAJ2_9HYPH|nr:ABC transporter substrate-binding protein [Ancylobacter crimeensis]MCK0196962.1 ABC transporter substrate-binding protein [Ancylobacter crimeensis]
MSPTWHLPPASRRWQVLAALLPFLLAGLLIAATTGARAEISIVDHAGRTVTLPAPARRIVLSDGIDLIALGLIDPHPVERLAGWSPRFLDEPTMALIRAVAPGIDAVPGITAGDAFPVEAALALRPDLIVLSPYFAGQTNLVGTLEAAGIAVAILSPSPTVERPAAEQDLLKLGRLVGREKEANAYLAFFEARIARIRDRLAAQPGLPRPKVLLEAHAGSAACCMSPGRGEGIGRFVDFAGGENIGAALISGMAGTLSLEYIIAADPAVYIATGGGYMASRGGVVLGPGRTFGEAEATLARVLARPGISTLKAVRDRRAYAIWHDLARSALNLVAIEAIARWIHPELFANLDPAATLATINRDFLAVPLTGTLLVGPESAPAP